ncbi:Sorting nexin-41 [Neonectria ditissima]|uniref:Sorting nexin-41 n=1 Tax=Neonectria ditissima TaxID=78410 RepID=A0A0P7AKT7_9HYPO|nr:Sorting nexin-41 [Neonectria ditissima]
MTLGCQEGGISRGSKIIVGGGFAETTGKSAASASSSPVSKASFPRKVLEPLPELPSRFHPIQPRPNVNPSADTAHARKDKLDPSPRFRTSFCHLLLESVEWPELLDSPRAPASTAFRILLSTHRRCPSEPSPNNPHQPLPATPRYHWSSIAATASPTRRQLKLAAVCPQPRKQPITMWNDEDNNPYGTSFDRRDSQTSSSANPTSPTARDCLLDNFGWDTADSPCASADRSFEPPHTPTSGSDDDQSQPAFDAARVDAARVADLDTDIASKDDTGLRRRPGGYDSRIEQILYENPELPIVITDAGKSLESGGRYIVYTIRTGDLEVRRRYSEFSSLRDALTRLHPTLVIPPIPEKHTMADYAANPTNAKQDQQIIDLRKRMLAVFLNRCRRMDIVRTDGVWWRFLDPNASWSEVLHSHPVASIPKSVLKAPPLDTANPTAAHNYLPVPPVSAKLKTVAGANHDTSSGVIQGGPHAFGRFPPDSHNLSEQELDPYFVSYEASIKEMELLLTGPMEKVNRRTLNHLSSLAADLCELGSVYNAFAVSEQAPSLGPAIERVGQAADLSYIATEELSGSLGASFAEPMRENAQFAGVVRSVLRYRVLKRVQQDLTTEELNKKRAILDQLERSEAEARRIENYLSGSQQISPPPKRSTSLREPAAPQYRRDGGNEDTESIDSDFPPTHGDFPTTPSASQGLPERSASVPSHKKMPSGNSITNKIFGPIRHAVQGVVDVDPERTRRDTIGKTRESIGQLEQAQVAAERDVKDASISVLKDLKRFQKDKEEDLRRYMLAYAQSQIEWAKKSKLQWEEARAEVEKIDEA